MALDGIQDVSFKIASPEIQASGAARQAAAAPPAENQQTGREGESSVDDISRESLEQAIDELNHAVSVLNHRINFSIDEETGRLMAKVIDAQTNEVIKQIPPERVMAFVRRFQEFIGLLLDEKA